VSMAHMISNCPQSPFRHMHTTSLVGHVPSLLKEA
jgi:hypothetical protein